MSIFVSNDNFKIPEESILIEQNDFKYNEDYRRYTQPGDKGLIVDLKRIGFDLYIGIGSFELGAVLPAGNTVYVVPVPASLMPAGDFGPVTTGLEKDQIWASYFYWPGRNPGSVMAIIRVRSEASFSLYFNRSLTMNTGTRMQSENRFLNIAPLKFPFLNVKSRDIT